MIISGRKRRDRRREDQRQRGHRQEILRHRQRHHAGRSESGVRAADLYAGRCRLAAGHRARQGRGVKSKILSKEKK